jgi:Protein of unknown function (DUF2934)
MKTNISSVILTSSVPHHLIAVRAYTLWAAAGQPVGCDYDHWVAAEQQLRSDQPAEGSLASRLAGWSDAFGTDIERALEAFAPNSAPRSTTSL